MELGDRTTVLGGGGGSTLRGGSGALDLCVTIFLWGKGPALWKDISSPYMLSFLDLCKGGKCLLVDVNARIWVDDKPLGLGFTFGGIIE